MGELCVLNGGVQDRFTDLDVNPITNGTPGGAGTSKEQEQADRYSDKLLLESCLCPCVCCT